MGNRITIRIGDKVFAATLSDNATAVAFEKLLPLSITMAELNGNEKFARLPGTVPARATTPSSIQTGDLMLYGSNTLVLFYKSFPTTYSYTKIGQLDNPAGLEAALGSGNVAVTFDVRRESGSPGRSGRAGDLARGHQRPRHRLDERQFLPLRTEAVQRIGGGPDRYYRCSRSVSISAVRAADCCFR